MSEQRSASPVREGEVIAGKYRVERVLGVGGMGVVVAATHLELEQRVALKFFLRRNGAPIVKVLDFGISKTMLSTSQAQLRLLE